MLIVHQGTVYNLAAPADFGTMEAVRLFPKDSQKQNNRAGDRRQGRH